MKPLAIVLLSACILGAPAAGAQQKQSAARANRAAYEAFKSKAKKSYADFRREANDKYAEFFLSAWEKFDMQPGAARPRLDTEPPRVTIEDGDSTVIVAFDAEAAADSTASFQEAIGNFFGRIKKGIGRLRKKKKTPAPAPKEEKITVKIVAATPPAPQPQPLAPVEVPAPKFEDAFKPVPTASRQEFTFFSVPCSVDKPAACDYMTGGVSNDAISKAWKHYSGDEFIPMLKDCLALRDSLGLNDWGYLKMLETMARAVYGGDTNEARLLTANLFTQSGYAMRISRLGDRIGIMFPSEYTVYERPYVIYKGMRFYDFNFGNGKYIEVMPLAFDNEANVRLHYASDQKIGITPTKPRRIKSVRYPDFEAEVVINKDIIDFYDTYPDGDRSGNHMTRYAFHANVPLDSCVRATLYPALREQIKGMSKTEAADHLLSWIQGGLEYEYDNIVWGDDRPFFPEESLFYPYCDCEDRAILYSRLVRDLLGLPVALVYYPGHLATAVNFADESDKVKGTYITLGDRRFYICDPTILGYGANIGTQMRGMQTDKIEAIEL